MRGLQSGGGVEAANSEHGTGHVPKSGEVMPPQLVHGSGRTAAKICKIGMGKLRHVLGSPKRTLVKVGFPQEHPSEVARSVVRRGEGPCGGHKDKMRGGYQHRI